MKFFLELCVAPTLSSPQVWPASMKWAKQIHSSGPESYAILFWPWQGQEVQVVPSVIILPPVVLCEWQGMAGVSWLQMDGAMLYHPIYKKLHHLLIYGEASTVLQTVNCMFSFQLASIWQAFIECQALSSTEETEMIQYGYLPSRSIQLSKFLFKTNSIYLRYSKETDCRERYFRIENKWHSYGNPLTTRPASNSPFSDQNAAWCMMERTQEEQLGDLGVFSQHCHSYFICIRQINELLWHSVS